MVPGLEVHDRMSFHGFTTYWMIKKASSCTVHCVENMASHQEDSIGQCTVPTVSPGEADQTSEVPLPQRCLAESHASAASSSTGSAGLSTAEGISWLILMKTSFILMNRLVRILS